MKKRKCVHDLHIFVTVQLFEDTPAVLSLGKLCKVHGYTFEWPSGCEPRPTQNGKQTFCKTENFVPLVVPGLSSSSTTTSSSTSPPQGLPISLAMKMRETTAQVFLNGWRSSQRISRS